MKNIFLVGVGLVMLALGAVGLVVPLLPTTPFVLVAAVCFSSTPALHSRVVRIPFVREYIASYEAGKGVSRGTVVFSLAFLWNMLLISAITVRNPWIIVLLGIVGLAVTAHVIAVAKPRQPRINGKIIFITGVSGTGKSTILQCLAGKGYATVDTDYGNWKTIVQVGDQGDQEEEIWHEAEIMRLLEAHRKETLFLSGCVSNQGRFYRYFSEIVVLVAPEETVLHRIRTRDNNPYGKTDSERQAILQSIAEVQPLLLRRATRVIDTQRPLAEIVQEIEQLLSN